MKKTHMYICKAARAHYTHYLRSMILRGLNCTSIRMYWYQHKGIGLVFACSSNTYQREREREFH